MDFIGDRPQPSSLEKLKELVVACLKMGRTNLNFIDTSKVDSFNSLFAYITSKEIEKLDISRWDTSNVKTMRYMFNRSLFNGDISKWDMSKVEDISHMFSHCPFNGNISK